MTKAQINKLLNTSIYMVYYVIFPLLLQLATQLASWAHGLRPRLKMRPNVKR